MMDSTNYAPARTLSWQEIVRSRLATLFWFCILSVLVPLWVLAAGRLLLPDVLQPFIVANLMTRYLYLPAYPIFLVALLRRKRGFAVVAGALAALHLAWMAPLLPPLGSSALSTI